MTIAAAKAIGGAVGSAMGIGIWYAGNALLAMDRGNTGGIGVALFGLALGPVCLFVGSVVGIFAGGRVWQDRHAG